MSLDYRGNLTLGACIPTALELQGHLTLSINLMLPELRGRLEGLIALSIRPPPALGELIASLQQTIASIEQLIASLQALLANPLPDINLTLQLIIELNIFLGKLTASLSFGLNIGLLLATPGVHFYTYAGRADGAGAEFSAALGGGLPGGSPGEHVAGVFLVASDGGATSAMQTMFGF